MSITFDGSRAVRVVAMQGAVAAVVALVAVAPASAQPAARSAETLAAAIRLAAADVAGRPITTTTPLEEAPLAQPRQLPRVPLATATDDGPRRPGLLLPLYGAFAVLQGLDAHSSLDRVRAGRAVERNPLLEPFGNRPGAVIAFKAATTAGTIVLAERMWRRHPVRAVITMAAVNAAYAAIVASNYRR